MALLGLKGRLVRPEPEPQDPSVQAVRRGRSVQVVRPDRRDRQDLPEVRLVPRVQLAHRVKQDRRAVLQARPDPLVRVGHKVLLEELERLVQVGHRVREEKRDQLAVQLVPLVRVVPQDPQDLPEAQQGRSVRAVPLGQAAQRDQAVLSGQAELPVLLDRVVQSEPQDPSVQQDCKVNPALPEGQLVRLVQSVHRAFRALPEGPRACKARLVRLGPRLRGTTPEHLTSESATPSGIWRPTKEISGIAKTLTVEM